MKTHVDKHWQWIMRDKWQRYGSYENWVVQEEPRLKNSYKKMLEKSNCVCPDRYFSFDCISFDDYCMGQWKSL